MVDVKIKTRAWIIAVFLGLFIAIFVGGKNQGMLQDALPDASGTEITLIYAVIIIVLLFLLMNAVWRKK
jgi:hypothetical protein